MEYTGPENGEQPGLSRLVRSEKEGRSEEEYPPKGKHWISDLIKVIVILLILIIAVVAGLTVGFVVFGKQPWREMLSFNIWRHVYDLVFSP